MSLDFQNTLGFQGAPPPDFLSALIQLRAQDPGVTLPQQPAPAPVAAKIGPHAGTGPAAAAFNFDPKAYGDWRGSITPDEAFIIQHESGFNPNSYNKTVVHDQGKDQHAFGLGQLIDENRQAAASALHLTNPNTTNPYEQLAMMRYYINHRYGSAANARAKYKIGVGY